MVRLQKSVECSAKIAMTTLLTGLVAIGLLPDLDLARRIFLGPRCAYLSILNSAAEPACVTLRSDTSQAVSRVFIHHL